MDIKKLFQFSYKKMKMLFIYLVFLYALCSPWFYGSADPQRYYQLALALLMLALLFELHLVNLRFAEFIRQPIRWQSPTGFLYLSALLFFCWGLWGIG
ncbi:hypothetical protein [Rheinheimera sp. MM224]|uniref:hypothetical protein n=1 Tax=Rheinheimera sp. MM224 TaxID=3019969 RepID=UPI0021F8B486|nr:hypothetical protein [Rheinheimera sp. MM224]CAI3804407.1 hypothetical protein JAMGFMIE_03612 [Rheinheimera sp. MM224]